LPFKFKVIFYVRGVVKQDCEINAAKRWLAEHGEEYGRLNTTVLIS